MRYARDTPEILPEILPEMRFAQLPLQGKMREGGGADRRKEFMRKRARNTTTTKT